MNWTSKLTVAGMTGALVFSALGCGPSEPGENQDDNVDEVTQPSIASFEAAPDTITSGVNVHADQVQGEVELSWETEDAAEVTIQAGETNLNLGECQPIDDDCKVGGTLTDEPDADTTYRINAVGDEDVQCDIDEEGEVLNPDVCASETAEVEVREPATISLDRDQDRFDPDQEFTVDFETENAEEFEFGIADGDSLADVCEIDDDDATCSRPDADSGELTFRDVDESITVSGWAENGADDELGDVQVGEVELDLHPIGAPVINEFDAEPRHVDYDGQTTLSWETEDTVEVEVTSDFEGLLETDLSTECTDVDGDGEGSCDVDFTDDTQFDGTDVTFSLVAISDDDEETDPTDTQVVFVLEPVIESFEADPVELTGASTDVDLSWDNANWPTRLVIEDEDGTVVDTDDGTGTDQCDTDGCDLDSGTATIEDLETNTLFTLTAESPLGSDIATVQVFHEDGPQIATLEVEGDDVFDAPAVVEADSADLTWDTENAEDTDLERGDVPEAGCDSGDVSWDDVTGFSGDADGTEAIEDLDQTEECFRLTANEDGGDQTASATFKIARSPEINDFDGEPETVGQGNDVTLSWETSFVHEVEVTADNLGAVNNEDLEECNELDADGDGKCDVEISPGTSADSVEFTITATGFDELTDDASKEVFIGEPPTIDDFCAQAESAGECESTTSADSDEEDVTLEWDLADDNNVAELSITDDEGEEIDGLDPESGTTTVDNVDRTTTWTLEVSNDFGEDSADATAFFGPVIEEFTANGDDALDGEAIVDTGDVTFEWTITDAEADTTQLDRADVPEGDGDTCGDVQDGEWDSLVDDGDADSSFSEDDVTENGCYRLMADDDGGLTSSVVAEVVEVPFVEDLETTPDSFDGEEGADVNVDIDVVGATDASVTARYFDDVDGDDDEIVTETTVCDGDDDFTGDSLDGSADTRSITCIHEMVGECNELDGCIGPDDPSEETDYIRYEFEFSDDEEDGGTVDSDEFGEDVDVEWDDD